MSEIGVLLLKLIFVLIFAKIGGWLAEKLKQPSVLGELIAGVILGPSVLNIIQPAFGVSSLSTQILVFLAELGAIVLLFNVGLESNVYKLLKVGASSLLVATIGVVTPFVLAFAYFKFTNHSTITALFIGATLTATSVGVTMRVLSDIKKVNSEEGNIILGAAVIDDILGLLILSVIVSLVELGKISLLNIGKISLWSILFLTLSLYLGIKLWPYLNKILFKLDVKRSFVISSLCLVFFLAYIAQSISLATIVGAFAAGLILETTQHKEYIKDRMKSIAVFFVPIFFVMAGIIVDVRTFTKPEYLPMIGILLAIAIISKYIAGFGIIKSNANKATVGLGMIPRGEVGLIFAAYGIAHSIISQQIYSVLVLVIMLTTFLTPSLLKWSLLRSSAIAESPNEKTLVQQSDAL